MMQRLQNIFDNLWAALILFTRLPWWRLHEVETSHFRHAAEYWPFAGWVTGGLMALCFWLCALFIDPSFAILLAFAFRIFLTGALHEDGLADFCDGMGGGRDRTHILSIMKDSHIGTYGVLGLGLYLLLLSNALQDIAEGYVKLYQGEESLHPIFLISLTLLTADIWSKGCASLLITQLPYARREEEATVRVVYAPMKLGWQLLRILIALSPIALLWYFAGTTPHPMVLLAPLLVEVLMALYLRKRLQGYTGDCCGATFLLCEASMYLTLLIIFI